MIFAGDAEAKLKLIREEQAQGKMLLCAATARMMRRL